MPRTLSERVKAQRSKTGSRRSLSVTERKELGE
jgi:hypothetical protein